MSIKKDANVVSHPPATTWSEADHACLLVALGSFGVLSEERFDVLAVDHLKRSRLTGRLSAIKPLMLMDSAAYRVELRGKPYLCRLRLADETDSDGRPLVVAWDVGQLLDALAAVAGGTGEADTP